MGQLNARRIGRVLVLCSLMVLAGCGGGSDSGGGGTKIGGSIQGKALALTGISSTLAGKADIGADGTGAAAVFNNPYGITTDGTNLYVADTYYHTIRKVVIATGAVTTLAGSAGQSGSTDGAAAAARFNEPAAITAVGTDLYVADSKNHTIRKVAIATGTVTTLAGSAGASGSIDGAGVQARFDLPYGITADGTNLYVSDGGNTIRQVVITSGAVTTLAGTAGVAGSTDGAGAAARFSNPNGITTDGTNLYVADSDNNTIRKVVIATGLVTTLAGTAGAGGPADGTGAVAQFDFPFGITTDGTNLYVADDGNHAIRKVAIATGAVTTLAGSAGASGSTDSTDGTGATARFTYPDGVATDGQYLYVTDCNGSIFFLNRGFSTIRKVAVATGAVTTLAGGAGPGGSTDGAGAAARFAHPSDVTTDGANLYVADSDNNTIRKVVIATGAVTTLAGSAGSSGSTDDTGTAARFDLPLGVTTDGANLYVTDSNNHTIRKVAIATGAVTTLAGGAGVAGSADGAGAAARFGYPNGITTDGAHLYVADTYNHTIRKVAIATGAVTTLAGSAGQRGSANGTGSEARFDHPESITTDGIDLYVMGWDHTIRKVAIATGAVTTLAGSAGSSGSTDGSGSAARFYYPEAITTDGTSLYVADTYNYTIRRVVIATGAVTTLAGSAGLSGSTDGNGSVSRFNYPKGITTDGTSLYLADAANNTIRAIK